MGRTLHWTASAALAAMLAAPAAALHGSATLERLPDRPAVPVVIDAGHGGNDYGAVVKGLNEKSLALIYALKLRDRLRGELAVALTREDDRALALDRRVVQAVDWNGAMFISLHLNKVPQKKVTGAVIYSYGPEWRRRWRPRIHHPKVPPMPPPPAHAAKESAQLSRELASALRAEGLHVGEERSDYYVLKNPTQPSVLIELGYLSNPEEAKRLADPAHQDRVVEALAKAILAYAAGSAIRHETASAR